MTGERADCEQMLAAALADAHAAERWGLVVAQLLDRHSEFGGAVNGIAGLLNADLPEEELVELFRLFRRQERDASGLGASWEFAKR